MPTAPPRACPCGGLIRQGKCDRCTNKRGHKQTTRERGYGYDWQLFRKAIIEERPLCERQERKHPEVVRPSMEVHHKLKIRERPDLRLDPDNVEALCEQCHDEATAAGE